MLRSWRHTVTALSVLAALLTGLVSEGLHHHPAQKDLSGVPSLMTHDCHGHEKHIPLDLLKECSLCQQNVQRLATIAAADDSIQPARVFIPACLSGSGTPVQPHYFSSGKRGPPAT